MQSLRSKLIRLAYRRPELRSDILPLLRIAVIQGRALQLAVANLVAEGTWVFDFFEMRRATCELCGQALSYGFAQISSGSKKLQVGQDCALRVFRAQNSDREEQKLDRAVRDLERSKRNKKREDRAQAVQLEKANEREVFLTQNPDIQELVEEAESLLDQTRDLAPPYLVHNTEMALQLKSVTNITIDNLRADVESLRRYTTREYTQNIDKAEELLAKTEGNPKAERSRYWLENMLGEYRMKDLSPKQQKIWDDSIKALEKIAK